MSSIKLIPTKKIRHPPKWKETFRYGLFCGSCVFKTKKFVIMHITHRWSQYTIEYIEDVNMVNPPKGIITMTDYDHHEEEDK